MSSTTSAEARPGAIGLLASGAVEVADLTTAITGLGGALDAFGSLTAAQTMKVLIAPNG